MSALPGDASPPKSGCALRPVPMNEMKLFELGSMGAVEMSRFHQLLRGNSGSGPGSGPPNCASAKMTALAATHRAIAAATRHALAPRSTRTGARKHRAGWLRGGELGSNGAPVEI